MDRTDREIEKALLLKSHTPERVEELLQNRYSLSGAQKPFLVLTPTQGSKNASQPVSPASRGASPFASAGQKVAVPTSSKSRRGYCRRALTQWISTARTAQSREVAKIRRLMRDGGATEFSESEQPGYIPKYEEFEQLHRLWRGYASDLIYGTDPSSTVSDMVAAGKLASADFHGAKLTVAAARNPSLIGVEGIVVWEARSSFVVVVPRRSGPKVADAVGGLRIIGKKGAKFRLVVFRPDGDARSGTTFDILGSRLLFRAADRAGRKFKTHAVDDL